MCCDDNDDAMIKIEIPFRSRNQSSWVGEQAKTDLKSNAVLECWSKLRLLMIPSGIVM